MVVLNADEMNIHIQSSDYDGFQRRFYLWSFFLLVFFCAINSQKPLRSSVNSSLLQRALEVLCPVYVYVYVYALVLAPGKLSAFFFMSNQ